MIEIKRTGAVGVLTLNRPETRNAISRALTAELSSTLHALQADHDVRVILLTGAPVFCAGADVAKMMNMSLLEALAEDFSGCCERLARCSKPLIAAVEGYAIGGGCELIDVRYCRGSRKCPFRAP